MRFFFSLPPSKYQTQFCIEAVHDFGFQCEKRTENAIFIRKFIIIVYNFFRFSLFLEYASRYYISAALLLSLRPVAATINPLDIHGINLRKYRIEKNKKIKYYDFSALLIAI